MNSQGIQTEPQGMAHEPVHETSNNQDSVGTNYLWNMLENEYGIGENVQVKIHSFVICIKCLIFSHFHV